MVMKRFGLSIRRACIIVGLSRSAFFYQRQLPDRDSAIRKRMHQIVAENPRCGCPMVHDILKRENLVENRKRTERIYYRDEQLSLRRRKRRRKAAHTRITVPQATAPGERWAMDFVHDSLWNGRKLRTLTIIDIYSKVSPAIEVDTSLDGRAVVRVLERLVVTCGTPKYITVDNGPEFRSKALDQWAYQNQVTLDFIRPGKPVDNCYIESFNSRFREECLSRHYFNSITEAKVLIEKWRKAYNEFRPHRALKGLTPREFAEKHQQGTQNTNLSVV